MNWLGAGSSGSATNAGNCRQSELNPWAAVNDTSGSEINLAGIRHGSGCQPCGCGKIKRSVVRTTSALLLMAR